MGHLETPTLEGAGVRLEPLTLAHLPALEAVAFEPSIWRYMITWVRTPADLREWVECALDTPHSLPWITIQKASPAAQGQPGSTPSSPTAEPDKIVGSTRFLDLNLTHRTVEIGHTWLTAATRNTRVNAEAKLLQLTYAFDTLGLNRVAFKAHASNHRSVAALKAIGAHPEGTFRSHLIMPDGSLRDSAWFSILREEWPGVRELLQHRLSAPV